MIYQKTIPQNDMALDGRRPDHPLDMSRMTKAQLNGALEQGYADMLRGDAVPLKEAFADIRKELEQ